MKNGVSMPFSISARWRSRRAGSGIFISRSSRPAPICFLSCWPNEIAKLTVAQAMCKMSSGSLHHSRMVARSTGFFGLSGGFGNTSSR